MFAETLRRSRSKLVLTLGVTALYVLLFALSEPASTPSVEVLAGVGVFTAPMIIASVLATMMRHNQSRTILLGFSLSYSVLTALVFWWTYGFEHDAQYQLTLMVITIRGLPSILAAGVAEMVVR